MKSIDVKWTGIRPLIMGNPQTVKITNPYAMESRSLNSQLKAARKKEDANRLVELTEKQAWNDWMSSAYHDKKGFYLPDNVIQASIRSGATASKKGREIDRAIIIQESEIYFSGIPKHDSLEAYFKDEAFVLDCPAKVPPKTGALIWKYRCMMPVGWVIEFGVEYEETLIAEKSLIEAMNTAGLLCGVGGWRPRFGRFLVEVKK